MILDIRLINILLTTFSIFLLGSTLVSENIGVVHLCLFVLIINLALTICSIILDLPKTF